MAHMKASKNRTIKLTDTQKEKLMRISNEVHYLREEKRKVEHNLNKAAQMGDDLLHIICEVHGEPFDLKNNEIVFNGEAVVITSKTN